MLRGSSGTGPRAQEDLGDWLVALSITLAIPPWIAKTIRHVGQTIMPETVDESWGQWRLFGSLERFLIGRLPTGSVAYLGLHAPFYDSRSNAVRALVQRFSPDSVEIGLQLNLAQ